VALVSVVPAPEVREWELYPFQVAGSRWLMTHPRSILADEMGLGKTIQVGHVLDVMAGPRGPLENVLILGRAVLGYQWQDELADKFGRDLVLATGLGAADAERLRSAYWVFTNYAKLRLPRFRDVILARRWDAIIVDEAHRLSGRHALQTKTLWRIAATTPRIHFLTGTPEPNGSPAEMWSWLKAIDPRAYRSYWAFVEEHCTTWTNDYGKRIAGPAKDPTRTLRSLEHLMLRRSAVDVGADLPALTFRRIRHDLTARQKAEYRRMLDDWEIDRGPAPDGSPRMMEARSTAERFVRLRQLCVDPALVGLSDVGGKFPAILDLVDEAHRAGRKVVVFTWHREAALHLALYLTDNSHPMANIFGGMAPEAQRRELANFRGGCHGIVGTIGSMAEGLNLQDASVGIFAEISYVAEENRQAMKRIYRHGQGRNVLIFDVVANGSVEWHIREVAKEKRLAITDTEMANSVLGRLRARISEDD
jgi:SNF2 family DNA or RNA helicase